MLRRRLRVPLVLVPLAFLGLDCGKASVSPPATTRAAAAPAAAPAGAAPLAPAAVDAAVRAAWQQEGAHPTPTVDDAGFLRRASLDITGVIPTPEAAAAFLDDPAPDKRRRLVDALLASPRYAEHWADYWDRVLLGPSVKRKLVDRDAFHDWLEDELGKNVRYDEMVRALVSATGISGNVDDEGPPDPGMNGAVNWVVKYRDTPQDLAGATSRIFLGVQIQCAQCHDHKTEKWKTDDFRRFAACFAETQARPIDPPGMPGTRRVEVRDLARIPKGNAKKQQDPELRAIAETSPTALDGTDFAASKNRRQALAAWITSPQNPWFARAIVNRVWAHFLGRGFVDPITDFRPSNPPVLPDVLDALARDFVAGGYDLKRLIRLVATTEVYQRSAAAPGAAAPGDDKLWARFHVEPLGPDELFDSVAAAVRLEASLEKRPADRTVDDVRRGLEKRLVFLFDVDEDSATEGFEGGVPQALFLMNGNLVNDNTRALPGSAVSDVMDLPGGDAARITSLYLRALSRRPAADEIATWRSFVGEGDRRARKQAYEDLFWALLNSSEFTFNH